MKTHLIIFLTALACLAPITHSYATPSITRFAHTPSPSERGTGGEVHDLGGYATIDYRRVSMRRIYRAGDLSRLTDSAFNDLKRRRIYTVIDFRNADEAAAAPDRLLPGTDYVQIPVGTYNFSDPVAFMKPYKSGTDAMLAFYSDISFLKETYRLFFRKLLMLPDTSAILFHCSNGKDRTGIAAALFLYILDVPMETIMADYLAVNFRRKAENEKTIDALVNEQGFDRKVAAEIVYASPFYLETTFETIKRKYGSIDAFFYTELGMDEQIKQRLREIFLR